MPNENDAINAAIRAAKGEPLDLTDPAAINRAIRQAKGVPFGDPAAMSPPPLPGEDEQAFRQWSDDAAAAGVSARELAAYTGRWLTQHRAILAAREANR